MAISKKVSFAFDPFRRTGISSAGLSEEKRRDILEEVGDFVLEQILTNVSASQSPVKGEGRFKQLSPDYRDFKASEGLSPVPDLELEGDMLDSLQVEVEGGRIRIGVSEEEAPKAANHNNFRDFGTPTLPKRQFIPRRAGFKESINQGMAEIILQLIEED